MPLQRSPTVRGDLNVLEYDGPSRELSTANYVKRLQELIGRIETSLLRLQAYQRQSYEVPGKFCGERVVNVEKKLERFTFRDYREVLSHFSLIESRIQGLKSAFLIDSRSEIFRDVQGVMNPQKGSLEEKVQGLSGTLLERLNTSNEYLKKIREKTIEIALSTFSVESSQDPKQSPHLEGGSFLLGRVSSSGR